MLSIVGLAFAILAGLGSCQRYEQYDPIYPQYEYKPYTDDCNREYFPEYVEYVQYFRGTWNNTKEYPRYEINQEQYDIWEGYGGNEGYEGEYPTNPGKKSRGFCCWQFKGPLPTRKPVETKLKRKRVEYRQLTKKQRNSLHKAMNKLKTLPSPLPGFNAWSLFVLNHRASNSPAAHHGAAFLPWHREYLFRLENALYKNGYRGPGLPYWDSTLDQLLPNPADSAIWTKDYFGNSNGFVNEGFAQFWPSDPGCMGPGATLRRDVTQGPIGRCQLFEDFDIDYVNGKNCFKDITCFTDCKLENDHAGVHNFVGGHMGNANCAPSDPVFFFHHAFVDCIWEFFRKNHQKTNKYNEYPSSVNGDNVGGPQFEWNAEMKPFFMGPGAPLLNGHGISKFYEAYYSCRGRPHDCTEDKACKSKLLWCNRGRCTAKVKIGGNCSGFPNQACFGVCDDGSLPVCLRGICTCLIKVQPVDEGFDLEPGTTA